MEKLLYMYSHGQELFYKFVSEITNKLVKQLLSMTVFASNNKDLSTQHMHLTFM